MEEVRIWLAIIGAVVVKIILSDKLTLVRSTATASAGIFSAWVFTDPFLSVVGW